MNKTIALRAGATVFAAAMLICAGAAAASAADEAYGDSDVDVTVEVSELEEGTLALTVAGTSTALTEQGSDELVRQFVGTLPAVTVTDTRSADEIPAGGAWYVLGSATDFIGTTGQDPIPAADLGWTPALTGANDGDGLVFAGEPVESAQDGGDGLADQELLFSTFDSATVSPEGQWSATADLTLRTGAGVAPGSYKSTITLSLFESVVP